MKAAIDHELNNRHFDFGPGQRHAMEVDFHTFRDELKKELKQRQQKPIVLETRQ